MDATAAGLVAKQRAAGPENTTSLAELFVSFLVETGAAFDAWADAAHMTGPENHDIYKCAARRHHGSQSVSQSVSHDSPVMPGCVENGCLA